MINATLTRFAYTPIGTFGVLPVAGANLYTVELPWMENKPGISCIPEGIYECEPRHFFRGNYPAMEVMHVPNRTHILFHIANTMHDVLGCIGIGSNLGYVNGLWAVTGSKAAFQRFMAIYGVSGFRLEIKHYAIQP